MRRRRGSASRDNQDRWLITYADLITLLMIFFVVMYAMSKLDANKYEILARSLQMEFNQSQSVLPLGDGIRDLNRQTIIDRMEELKPDPETRDEEALARQKAEKKLQDLMKTIEQYVSVNGLDTQIRVEDRSQGIAITLKDLFLFDLGRAELKPPAFPLLAKLASLFPKLDTKISIEGHTDDLPLATGSIYEDNWGLSAARALSVLRYFVDEARLDEKQFVIAGYADTRPVVPNTSNANRQMNRRVEIIILRSSP